MKKIFFGFMIAVSMTAQASMLEIDCPDCNYPPVTEHPAFTFEEAAGRFGSAKIVSPVELVGSWKQIAGAQVKDEFGSSTMMGYNEEGIKNFSGNVLTLEVSATTISGGFFDNEPRDATNVIISNLGRGVQGPFEVLTNEAGQACFSTKAYDGTKSYFAFECRKVPKSTSKILCAITFNSGGQFLHSKQKPFDGKIVMYLGFSRNN